VAARSKPGRSSRAGRGGKRAAKRARGSRVKARVKRARKPARKPSRKPARESLTRPAQLPEVHFVGPGLALAPPPPAPPAPKEPAAKPPKKKPTIIPPEWYEFEGEYYGPEEEEWSPD
jgi:hypothetical protein